VELTDLTIRMLVLFFPGIVATLVVEALAFQHDNSISRFIVKSFVMGMFTYITLSFFIWTFQVICTKVPGCTLDGADYQFLDIVMDSTRPVRPGVLAAAVLVAVAMALLVSRAVKDQWLFVLAHKLGVTDKIGGPGVWKMFFLGNTWFVFRDRKHDLAYQGWAEAGSDTINGFELVLRDVEV